MIRFRAFRAIDDAEACMKFAVGHQNVLKSYGVENVTSANLSWLKNPDVYVIIVEDAESREVLGGTRIHVASNAFPLPMEKALGELDHRVYGLLQNASVNGIGELCGLWTSKESSGKGLSILLTDVGVAEAGIAFAYQLKIGSLYVLCAPWTVKMAANAGFKIEKSVGNEGTFFYPAPDLLATLLVIDDIETLQDAVPVERDRIIDLRTNPKQKKIEYGPKGELEIEYDLMVPGAK